jgi:hypothetical protein
MKLIIFALLFLTASFAKEQKVSVTTTASVGLGVGHHSQGDIIGEAYNAEEHRDIVAVTYGIASDGGHTLPDLTGYKQPQIVEKLPAIIAPPSPGPLENVDEVPSQTTYYDGSLHLNVAHINCHVISVPLECVRQTVCGWCGNSNSCVRGTAIAPLEVCSSAYTFNAPNPNWNPLKSQ